MEIIKPYDTLYSIGVIWNVPEKFFSDIMKEIAIEEPVIQIRKYDMGEKYIEFVRKCYEQFVSEKYLSQKTSRMEQSDNRDMIVFVSKIDNPQYHYDSHKEKYPCTQVSDLKKHIRGLYKDKVDNYFYDVILHMSDEPTETELMLDILSNYEDCITENFVRKGYKPYIKGKEDIKSHETYCSILKSIDDRESR